MNVCFSYYFCILISSLIKYSGAISSSILFWCHHFSNPSRQSNLTVFPRAQERSNRSTLSIQMSSAPFLSTGIYGPLIVLIWDVPQVPDSLEIKDLKNQNPILTHGWENRFGLESDIKSDIFIYWMRDKA